MNIYAYHYKYFGQLIMVFIDTVCCYYDLPNDENVMPSLQIDI